MPNTFKNQ